MSVGAKTVFVFEDVAFVGAINCSDDVQASMMTNSQMLWGGVPAVDSLVF